MTLYLFLCKARFLALGNSLWIPPQNHDSGVGPYAPAFLVCLEIISGELEGALASVKLIYDLEEPLLRAAVMRLLGRLLRVIELDDKRAQELVTWLILITEGSPISREQLEDRRAKTSKGENLDKVRQKALYLTASVIYGLQSVSLETASQAPVQESELHQLILDAIYTALYSELFYGDSAACRMYADMVNGMIQDKNKPANLKGDFFEKEMSASSH